MNEFDVFLSLFSPDQWAVAGLENWTSADTIRLVGYDVKSYTEFLSSFAYSSYNGGRLRFLLQETSLSLESWNSELGWRSNWKHLQKRLVIFAYDWLGRQIGFDLDRVVSGEPLLAMLEPGTGELLAIPQNFLGFITDELTNYQEALLAESFYDKWIKSGGSQPRFQQCVGYKVPLFMSGSDEVSNLNLVDVSVYVSLCGQLFQSLQ